MIVVIDAHGNGTELAQAIVADVESIQRYPDVASALPAVDGTDDPCRMVVVRTEEPDVDRLLTRLSALGNPAPVIAVAPAQTGADPEPEAGASGTIRVRQGVAVKVATGGIDAPNDTPVTRPAPELAFAYHAPCRRA